MSDYKKALKNYQKDRKIEEEQNKLKEKHNIKDKNVVVKEKNMLPILIFEKSLMMILLAFSILGIYTAINHPEVLNSMINEIKNIVK